MKRIFCIIIGMIFLIITGRAQNVGIGTSNPVSKLHVHENGTSSVFIDISNNLISMGMGLVSSGTLASSYVSLSLPSGVPFNIDQGGFPSLIIGGNSNVGIGNFTPDASAALDISANNKGILIPRMTNAQMNAIPNPANGLLVYRTDLQGAFQYFTGTNWVSLNSQLELIIQNNKAGWRLRGALPSNYGNIGAGAMDLSISNEASSSRGATGDHAFASGYGTTASAENSNASGFETQALEYASVAMGGRTVASGNYSTALGLRSLSDGNGSLATGVSTQALAERSTAMGSETTASGFASTSVGASTLASGQNSFAGGSGSTASAPNTLAFGFNANANTSGAIALGASTKATGLSAMAFGASTEAAGGESTAFGFQSKASFQASTAFGFQTTASQFAATAFGNKTVASGNSATSFGENTTASGSSSTAFGNGAIASENTSTAFGLNTRANGVLSTAFGTATTASGQISTAFGANSVASANNSTAFGQHTTASSFNSLVIGRYNVIPASVSAINWIGTDPLFVIGNGTSNVNRSNAITVIKNGNTGFGIDNPVSAVHANSRIVIERPTGGNATSAALEWRSNGAYRGGLGWDVNAARFFFYDGKSNTNTMFINNGRIGIQRDPTTNALEVNGSASKSSAGDWIANSDARLKKNIKPISGALEKLLQLKGITYEWNDDKTGFERPAGSQFGFTAQNIQKVFPELVSADAQGYLQTAYGTYDAVMVEAMRELMNKVEVLEKRIKELEIKN